MEYYCNIGVLIVGDLEVGCVEFDGKIEELKFLLYVREEVKMV